MKAFVAAYRGKRVFVTGHTGFKGSWLTLWLRRLGADVTGFSLVPATNPAMFDLCDVADGITHIIGDIRDHATLASAIAQARPDVLFHLAAQPIVRQSYQDPIETVATNILGTAHVLESVRKAGQPCAIVVVTSDKCYANREWPWGYRETDPMGGSDPYSMSKGACELLVDSWRRSFFSRPDSSVRVASGRAGNVIGGGDWAQDRIMTDCVNAIVLREPLRLRNPLATRPWQHVLEPLSGYLWLGALLQRDDGQTHAEGWNFGPSPDSICTVEKLVERCFAEWGEGSWQLADDSDAPKEAMSLSLAIEKARYRLGWAPVWSIDECIRQLVAWYKSWALGGSELRALTMSQIAAYEADAAAARVDWARPL